MEISFNFCHLSLDSIELLAKALEENTSITAFTLDNNQVNGDHLIRNAIINTKAPIKRWNNKPLTDDVAKARQRKRPLEAPTASSVELLRLNWKGAEDDLTEKRAKYVKSENELVDLDVQIKKYEEQVKTLKEQRFELAKQITQDKRQVATGEKETSKQQRQWETASKRLAAGLSATPPAPSVKLPVVVPKTPVAATTPKAPSSAAAAAAASPEPTCPDCKTSKMTRELTPCGHKTCGNCVRKAIKDKCCICGVRATDSVII